MSLNHIDSPTPAPNRDVTAYCARTVAAPPISRSCDAPGAEIPPEPPPSPAPVNHPARGSQSAWTDGPTASDADAMSSTSAVHRIRVIGSSLAALGAQMIGQTPWTRNQRWFGRGKRLRSGMQNAENLGAGIWQDATLTGGRPGRTARPRGHHRFESQGHDRPTQPPRSTHRRRARSPGLPYAPRARGLGAVRLL